MPQPGCSMGAVAAPAFESALAAILAREPGYQRLNGLTAASHDYVEPAAYCRAALKLALAVGPVQPADRARFFDWACAHKPNSILVQLLAAEQALEDGDTAKAAGIAARAAAMRSNDLHAQQLHRRCTQPAADDDDRVQGRFCRAPFEYLETAPNGDVHFCCPAWLPAPIGNLHRQDAEQIWNSAAAQEIRASILDGSYRYCSRVHCPHISGDRLPPIDRLRNQRHRQIVASGERRLPRGPQRLVLSHDQSCNLSCPSCRTQVIVARKAEQDRLNELAERVLFPLLRDARRVRITGSGDPFASAHFRQVMARLARTEPPGPVMELQTNGLLLDEAAWRELGLGRHVDKVLVSIDAARADTYRVVRRGGSFERLMENLAFIARLRREGEVAYIRLDCVVQALNYREMPEIVELARRLGFDGAKFQMIRNWNTYGPAEFQRHNIGSPGHPEYPQLLAVLRDPRLTAPDVELWGMADAVRDAALAVGETRSAGAH